MARKTFISYKYSEAREIRDRIISTLGDDAKYYKGETSESPDLTDYKTDTIRSHLKDMIYYTSVMIVIISPKMKESNWINWEIEYALKDIKRGNRTSHSNGILGVIMDDPDEKWFASYETQSDGHVCRKYKFDKTFEIIERNQINQTPLEYYCKNCKSISGTTGSYISIVTEREFFDDPNFYIENAYEKSQKLNNYEIVKITEQNDKRSL